MVNAASTRQIERAKRRVKEDLEAEQATLTNLMRHPTGRRWMWLLLADCAVFQEDFNTDYGYMAFQKGQRNLGLRLLKSVLLHCPEQYIAMTTENSSLNLQEQETTDGRPDTDD